MMRHRMTIMTTYVVPRKYGRSGRDTHPGLLSNALSWNSSYKEQKTINARRRDNSPSDCQEDDGARCEEST
jgi:hypothetical protein